MILRISYAEILRRQSAMGYSVGWRRLYACCGFAMFFFYLEVLGLELRDLLLLGKHLSHTTNLGLSFFKL
jgi:hypothetical protein